ncbi:unnamed protein product [Rhodiola kirilowii]
MDLSAVKDSPELRAAIEEIKAEILLGYLKMEASCSSP